MRRWSRHCTPCPGKARPRRAPACLNRLHHSAVHQQMGAPLYGAAAGVLAGFLSGYPLHRWFPPAVQRYHNNGFRLASMARIRRQGGVSSCCHNSLPSGLAGCSARHFSAHPAGSHSDIQSSSITRQAGYQQEIDTLLSHPHAARSQAMFHGKHWVFSSVGRSPQNSCSRVSACSRSAG